MLPGVARGRRFRLPPPTFTAFRLMTVACIPPQSAWGGPGMRLAISAAFAGAALPAFPDSSARIASALLLRLLFGGDRLETLVHAPRRWPTRRRACAERSTGRHLHLAGAALPGFRPGGVPRHRFAIRRPRDQDRARGLVAQQPGLPKRHTRRVHVRLGLRVPANAVLLHARLEIRVRPRHLPRAYTEAEGRRDRPDAQHLLHARARREAAVLVESSGRGALLHLRETHQRCAGGGQPGRTRRHDHRRQPRRHANRGGQAVDREPGHQLRIPLLQQRQCAVRRAFLRRGGRHHHERHHLVKRRHARVLRGRKQLLLRRAQIAPGPYGRHQHVHGHAQKHQPALQRRGQNPLFRAQQRIVGAERPRERLACRPRQHYHLRVLGQPAAVLQPGGGRADRGLAFRPGRQAEKTIRHHGERHAVRVEQGAHRRAARQQHRRGHAHQHGLLACRAGGVHPVVGSNHHLACGHLHGRQP